MVKLLYVIGLLFLSGCSWTSFIASKEQSALLVVPISANAQNKLNEPVPLTISGGTAPYSLQLVAGMATIDNSAKTVMTNVPGLVTIKITDSNGIEKTVDINFSGNQAIQQGAMNAFVVSADFSKIYYARNDGSGKVELFKVNSDGTGTEKIVASGMVVGAFTIDQLGSFGNILNLTPDQQKIVFRARDTTGVYRLYAINTSGTGATQLSGNYVETGQSVLTFKIISNNQVSFTDGEQETGGDVEPWLRVVNIDGTGRVLAHPNYGSNGDGQQVWQFRYSQDNSKVFFFSQLMGNAWTGLYVTNSDGSSNGGWTRVTPNTIDFWITQTTVPRTSPDNSKILAFETANAYVCATSGAGCFSYAGWYWGGEFSFDNTYARICDFTNCILANATMSQSVALGLASSTYKFINGSNFIYQSVTSSGTISRTPLTTAAPVSWVQLNPVFPGHANISSMTVTADNQKIYFIVDDEYDKVYRLYKMNLDGSGATIVNTIAFDLNSTPAVVPVINTISSDEKRMLIQTGQDLYMVNLLTQSMVKLTDRAQTTSTISVAQVLDDVQKIFYTSNQNTLSLTELFKIISPF